MNASKEMILKLFNAKVLKRLVFVVTDIEIADYQARRNTSRKHTIATLLRQKILEFDPSLSEFRVYSAFSYFERVAPTEYAIYVKKRYSREATKKIKEILATDKTFVF